MAAPRQRYRRGTLPAESEAAFMQKILGLAGFTGWMAYHTHRSDRSAPGFPDLVMVRGARLVFAEVKAESGGRRATVAEVATRPAWLRHRDVTGPQASWLEALRRVHDAVDHHVALDEFTGLTDPSVPERPSVEVHLWRPSDWPAIERCLARASWEGGPHHAPPPLS